MMTRPLFLTITLAILASSTAVKATENFSATATPDTTFNQLFNRCGPGITGGDSTYSTPVSATEVMWLFSDSFIGRVAADGLRSNPSSQFVQGNTLALHNLATGKITTYLSQSTGSMHSTQTMPSFPALPYDTANCPASSYTLPKGLQAMFQPGRCPSEKHCYYWGGGIVSTDKHLHVFLQLMEHQGSNIFDFTWHNSAIATLPLDALQKAQPTYTNVTNNGVSYGGAVMKTDKYVYIYGMRAEPASNSVCSGHCLHVARVPHNSLNNAKAWRYWGSKPNNTSSQGWIKNAGASLPMAGSNGITSAPKTQDQLGITRASHCGAKLTECYIIIAHQYTGGFTNTIQAWYAAQPQGPWTGPAFVYTTPESTQPGQLFTYNAKIHPEFTNDNGLLVSYDVNGLAPFTNPLNPFITAASYRPRFIRVKLHWQP